MFERAFPNSFLERKSLAPVSILACVLFASIWFGLGATKLWDRDEPRNARCAVEMLERNDWVVPMFNRELRTHKPILLYWLQMPAMIVFGETEFASRFGSALLASLSVAAVYWFGRRQIDSDFGFWSAAALATSLMFVVAARAATPDACLIGCTTIAILCLANHVLKSENQFSKSLFAGYVALGLAVLAKGPVGLVLPMMVVGAWVFVQACRESFARAIEGLTTNRFSMQHILNVVLCGFEQVLRRLHPLKGLLLCAAVCLPWYVWVGMRTDGKWLYGFFVEHNLGRAVTAMEGHRGGWWFYPVAALPGLFPWSLLVVPIAWWSVNRLRDDCRSSVISLGIIWMAVYIVLFSFAKTKLPSYITPCYPGAALLIGGFLADWKAKRVILSKPLLVIGAVVFIVVGVGMAAGLTVASQCNLVPALGLHSLWSLGFAAVGLGLTASTFRDLQHRMPTISLSVAAMFLAGMFTGAAPSIGRGRTDLVTMQSIAEANHTSDPSRALEWCSVRTIEPSWVYYLRTTIEELPCNGSPADSNFGSTNGEVLEAINNRLQSPQCRLIVNEDEVENWQRLFRQHCGVELDKAAEFSAFLKDDRIAVLQPISKIAEGTTRKVSGIR